MLDYQIRTLKPEAIRDIDYEVRDDGAGPFIARWNQEKLGAKPAVEDLPDGTALLEKELDEKDALRVSLELAEVIDTLDKVIQGQPAQISNKVRSRAQKRKEVESRRRGLGGDLGNN